MRPKLPRRVTFMGMELVQVQPPPEAQLPDHVSTLMFPTQVTPTLEVREEVYLTMEPPFGLVVAGVVHVRISPPSVPVSQGMMIPMGTEDQLLPVEQDATVAA